MLLVLSQTFTVANLVLKCAENESGSPEEEATEGRKEEFWP